MDPTKKTIDFLRGLTYDGFLSGEEVWALGKFFIDHPQCAEAWPGELLAPMLESAFDDANLSEEEMSLIAETITSIEQEWRLKNPPTQSGSRAMGPVTLKPALIPVIDAKFEIPARSAESYLVGLNEHTCTCPDWSPRKALPARHPGKCCQHVAYAFTRTGKVFEPWFQALLDDCYAHARGTNPTTDWHLVQLPPKPVLLGGGKGPWWNIFAHSGKGYESFSFNSDQLRWSFGTAPEIAPIIEKVIRDNFRPMAA